MSRSRTASPAPPPTPVRSMNELFAIAHAMEADAVAYYVEMAAAMRARDDAGLAAVFDRLADVERGHVGQIEAWSESARSSPPASSPLPWPAPDTFDAPAAEAGQSRRLTPYRALAAAVRQEERSFAFWAYVSAHAVEVDVKSAAERMAREELEHVALLRRVRRDAFHAERRARAAVPAVLGLGDLAALERALADRLDADSPAPRAAQAALARSARDNAARLDASADAAFRLTLDDAAAPDASALAAAEFLVDAYLMMADVAPDERIVALAQDLAATAITRLARLRARSRPIGGG